MSKRIALALALIGLAALVAAGTVILVRDDSETPPEARDVTPDGTATTIEAGDATLDDTVTTIEAGGVVPDESVATIEAGGLEWRRADLTAVGYDAMRIVEGDDGFLALGYKVDEGEITTWSSEDGLSWKELSTDTEALQPGEFIMEVVATPGGYLATGGEAEWWWGEGPVDRMWNSADGANWTRHDFDLADVARPNPYVTGEGTIQGISAGPSEIVLVGTSVLDLDHQAILDEIAPGTDAGDEMMTGVGIMEPSGKAGVEYAIDGNWVRMTFEEMGLPPGFVDELGTQTLGVWRSGDGSAWTPCPEALEWKIDEYAPTLVSGPNGYIVDGGDMLYLSRDAEAWSEIPAEIAFGTPTTITAGNVTGWKNGWAAIVGAGVAPREGPVEGTDFSIDVNAVLTSTDGTSWNQSVVPTSMLLSEGQASLDSLRGGEFGLFAFLSPESDEPDLSNGELWWSTDAVTWDPIQVGTTFGINRVIWDLTISTDRVVVLAADWTGWQDTEETEEDVPAPLELWVATTS